MAYTLKAFGPTQLSGSGASTIYTVPASTQGILKHFTISNANASARTVQIWIVPTGGSATDSNALINALSIPGNGVLTWDGFQVLPTAGDTIQGQASATTSLTFRGSGMEQT